MFQFFYSVFYKYYVDKTNLHIDEEMPRPTIYYFHKNIKYNKLLPKYYIIANGERVYIDDDKNGGLFFTIPEKINEELYDNHYYIGKRRINNMNKSTKSTKKFVNALFFHKTIQQLDDKCRKSIHTNCFFEDNIWIDDITEIICYQLSDGNMKAAFSSTNDIDNIREILSKPFTDSTLGGSRRNTLKNNRRRTRHRRSKLTHKNNKFLNEIIQTTKQKTLQ